MKGGNEGSEWAWRKEKRGNLFNARRGAIVAGYKLLAGERILIQVAPTFVHLGAEHGLFSVIAPAELPQSLNQDSVIALRSDLQDKKIFFFFEKVFNASRIFAMQSEQTIYKQFGVCI